MFKLLKNEKYLIFFSSLMVTIFGVSFYIDVFYINEIFWFQRSGALIVLAGVGLQYSKITSLWKKAGFFMVIPSSELDPDSPEYNKKIGGMSAIEKKTLDMSECNNELITKKSIKDTIAVAMILIGTLVWAYGDIPFNLR